VASNATEQRLNINIDGEVSHDKGIIPTLPESPG